MWAEANPIPEKNAHKGLGYETLAGIQFPGKHIG